MELTLLVADRQLDLSLPPQLPIVLLEPDLRSLTGLSRLRLCSLTGAPLDHDRSLSENGVRSGALVRCEPAEARLMVYDDPVDVAPRRETAAPSVPFTGGGVFAAVLAAHLLSGLTAPIAEALVLLGASATGWWQRGAVRLSGATPDDDPRDPRALGRLAVASRAATWGRWALELLALAGGLALLTRPGAWSAPAGWCCLAMITLRAHGSDPTMLRVGLGALAAGLALTLQLGVLPGPVLTGLVGVLGVLLAIVARPSAGPTCELWTERGALALTIAAPALALVGSGLLPGVP
ncbi:EsaB/YukD family protein [Blastococcus sp. Marseille-P5729]|uniref:EsaB/YukD family protein n=1 Tax=Blastococcus sp. Marseille-P5729 TaxID=2086582 RepID=UPI00131C1D92|nr:EsaB/YukD family protein [Blastococcus sp. Marseille-P5729]